MLAWINAGQLRVLQVFSAVDVRCTSKRAASHVSVLCAVEDHVRLFLPNLEFTQLQCRRSGRSSDRPFSVQLNAMDLRQFFEGFFRLNEELNSFFEESSLINKDIFGGGGNQQDDQREISPRSLMLKRDSPPDRSTGSLIDLIDRGDNFFRSKTFEKTFNSDLSVSKPN